MLNPQQLPLPMPISTRTRAPAIAPSTGAPTTGGASNRGLQRHHFLDWVRIFAFFVLILYHVGMYYVSWDWHVKSPNASSTIEPLMRLTAPWRMGLLFMISGVASSFMLGKMAAGPFVRSRSRRLLIPLLFGMLVIVPLQPYFEVVEKVNYQGSFADFMPLYLTGYHGFCRGTSCLDLPTWNHLWFVAYLWLYTLLLGLVVTVWGRSWAGVSDALARQLTGWKLMVLPALVLALARVTLSGRFPATHDVVGDWYNHVQYLSLFFFGALMARHGSFWESLARMRWTGLGLALACWAFLVVFTALPDGLVVPENRPLWWDLQRSVYGLCQWSAVVAACGFAQRHLQMDGPARRYLTQAVFPVYIVHQTLIVTMAHLLQPAGLMPAIEALVLITLTLCLSFGIFEVVRRVPLLRPLFGLPRHEAPGRTFASTPAPCHSVADLVHTAQS